MILLAGVSYGLPESPTVVHGQVQVNMQGGTATINQQSPNAIIDWRAFNISQGEIVKFLQLNSSSAILNRVRGLDPSVIDGLLQANGKVFLVNPNGILVGRNGVVDVGSFMASTLNISNDDFLAGRYNFVQDAGTTMAAIVNQGKLQVAPGGFLVLTSPLIHQDGLIVAQQGQVQLGATREATLNFDGQGLLEMTVPAGYNQGTVGPNGPVLLTQGQMSGLLSQVVTSTGTLEAGSLATHGEGLLINSGTISAEGGRVHLDSSQATLLAPTSNLQAGPSGRVEALSGGRVLQLGQINAGSVVVSGSGLGRTLEPGVLYASFTETSSSSSSSSSSNGFQPFQVKSDGSLQYVVQSSGSSSSSSTGSSSTTSGTSGTDTSGSTGTSGTGTSGTGTIGTGTSGSVSGTSSSSTTSGTSGGSSSSGTGGGDFVLAVSGQGGSEFDPNDDYDLKRGIAQSNPYLGNMDFDWLTRRGMGSYFSHRDHSLVEAFYTIPWAATLGTVMLEPSPSGTEPYEKSFWRELLENVIIWEDE